MTDSRIYENNKMPFYKAPYFSMSVNKTVLISQCIPYPQINFP